MKKLIAIAAVSMLALVGCGGDEDVVESGTYNITNVVLTSALDACGVGEGLREGTMLVEAAGQDVTLFADTGTKPVGTVADDNTFTATAESTLTEEGCTFKVAKTFTGTVVSETEITGTYTYASEVVSGGSACTEAVLLFTPPSCTSTHTLTATLAPEAAPQQ